MRSYPYLSLAVLTISLNVAVSSGAEAACPQWDISGDWAANQSNGFQPRFVLRKTTTGFQGDAAYVMSGGVTTYLLVAQKGNPAKVVRGSATGTVKGDSIEVTAQWNNGSVGIYTATINDFGRMQGTTYDSRNPSSMASWVSDRNMKCANAASAPKPAKALGKRPYGTPDYGGVAKPATCGRGMMGTPPNCYPLVR